MALAQALLLKRSAKSLFLNMEFSMFMAAQALLGLLKTIYFILL